MHSESVTGVISEAKRASESPVAQLAALWLTAGTVLIKPNSGRKE
jgi:hypothetical protein